MLLPIVDRPVVQYAVEEVIRAGVTDICIVISEGSESIADHFGRIPELEALLQERGKTDLLEEVRALSELANFEYITQEEPLGLGHAVLIARDFIGDEPFMCALPDEIYDPAENILGEMAAAFEKLSHSVITVTEVPKDLIRLYGSIDVEEIGDLMAVKWVVEKPDPDEAPSNFAIVGRYVLDPEIFPLLAALEPGAGGEIQLTDALDSMAKNGRLSAQLYRGRRWDAGNKDGFLRATVTLASERSDLGPSFRQFLEEFVAEERA